ncbi:MAG TPA: tRNA (adenosine(37)-N6)-threonylcarbamoyltransferase complex ATPase subunit type 1 TsaE [Devosia sp.]|nr:tRNA (adenosine(37)-N6)-threonylcarbamoyltransferase complex ATPase subunit type 1 TsaE [Devosia sp.]
MERFLADDEATAAFGQELADMLVPGDIVSLEGELGAGKSALARATIRALAGDPELEVPSPTFALVQPYDTPRGPVLHADLYRLGDAAEADELGLLDTAGGFVLVEWAGRAAHVAAAATIVITLAIPPGGSGRKLTMTRSTG